MSIRLWPLAAAYIFLWTGSLGAAPLCGDLFMATEALTEEGRSDYRGPHGYYRDDPVFAKMQERHDRGETVPAADVFSMLMQERNLEACNCSPGKAKELAVAGMSVINSFFQRMFGRSISKEAMFRKAFGAEIAKSKGDPDAIDATISRERSRFIKSFKESVRMDVQFTGLYQETYYLLQSVRAQGIIGLEAFDLINKQDRLIREIIKVQREKAKIETEGKHLERDAANAGEYSRLSIKLRESILELQETKKKIERVKKQRRRTRASEEEKLEYELLRRLELIETRRKESQLALAKFYVQFHRLRILESMLDGDLNNLAGPVDVEMIGRLNDLFEQHRPYLSHSKVFGPYYQTGYRGISDLDAADSDAVAKYNTVKSLAEEWMAMWYGRLVAIETRTNFEIALSNISMELYRVWVNNNIKAQKDNLERLAKGSFSIAVKTAKNSANFLLRRSGSTLSEKEQAEVNRVKRSFFKLAKLARGSVSMSRDEIRDHLSIIQIYLSKRGHKNEKIADEVLELFASAKAMDIYNWIKLRAAENETMGDPYNMIVANTIMRVQMVQMVKYQNLGSELMQHLSVWVTGAAATYYAILPSIKWFVDYLD